MDDHVDVELAAGVEGIHDRRELGHMDVAHADPPQHRQHLIEALLVGGAAQPSDPRVVGHLHEHRRDLEDAGAVDGEEDRAADAGEEFLELALEAALV